MQLIQLNNEGPAECILSERRSGIYYNKKKLYTLRKIDKFTVYSLFDENTQFNNCLEIALSPPLDEYILPSITWWYSADCNTLSDWNQYTEQLKANPSEEGTVACIALGAKVDDSSSDTEYNISDDDESEDTDYDKSESENDNEEEDPDQELIYEDDTPDIFINE